MLMKEYLKLKEKISARNQRS